MSLNICGMVPIRKAEREAAGRFLCHSGDIVFILLFVCPGPGMVWYSGNTGVCEMYSSCPQGNPGLVGQFIYFLLKNNFNLTEKLQGKNRTKNMCFTHFVPFALSVAHTLALHIHGFSF